MFGNNSIKNITVPIPALYDSELVAVGQGYPTFLPLLPVLTSLLIFSINLIVFKTAYLLFEDLFYFEEIMGR